MNKCPFINQLRYCYASAEITTEGTNVSIRFHQELNIECGIEAMRFLLQPLSELSEIECSYTINISTPSMVYLANQVTLQQGIIKIEPIQTFGAINQAS